MTSLPEKLAEISRTAGVKSAYGEPIHIDGVTLVPVAIVQYGFGGGDSGDQGSGGGGGGASLPIGAYVKSAGTVRFEPNVIALLTVAIPFVCVTGHALSRIIRALKK